MAWIKRNLLLVISAAVALALLALGGYYLYSALEKNAQIDEEIKKAKAEIERLLGKPVTPNAENLKLAKAEAVKLNAFVADAKKLFPPSPAPTEPLTTINFKSLLARTVSELHQQAASAGIKTESNSAGPYYFTFEAQRLPVSFPPESLRPLSERLHEVQFIAQVLFKARINRLVGMRRAMVMGERPTAGAMAPGGGNDYLNTGARTNAETGMMIWPYEVIFDCFTPELAAALEGLQSAQYGLLVKDVNVHPADETAALPGQPAPPPGRNPGASPPRRGGGPGANPAVRPVPGAPGLVNIINERLLRVTLRIEVIKPEGFSPGGPGGGPGGRGRGGGLGAGGPGGGGPGRGAAPGGPGGQP